MSEEILRDIFVYTFECGMERNFVWILTVLMLIVSTVAFAEASPWAVIPQVIGGEVAGIGSGLLLLEAMRLPVKSTLIPDIIVAAGSGAASAFTVYGIGHATGGEGSFPYTFLAGILTTSLFLYIEIGERLHPDPREERSPLVPLFMGVFLAPLIETLVYQISDEDGLRNSGEKITIPLLSVRF